MINHEQLLDEAESVNAVYHLLQIPGNSCWDVNGKRFFGSFHWKIPGTNGNSEKVVPFSRLGRSEWKFVYKFLEFRTSFMLQLESSLARRDNPEISDKR